MHDEIGLELTSRVARQVGTQDYLVANDFEPTLNNVCSTSLEVCML